MPCQSRVAGRLVLVWQEPNGADDDARKLRQVIQKLFELIELECVEVMQAHRNAMPQGQVVPVPLECRQVSRSQLQRMPPGGELVCERSRCIRFGAEDQYGTGSFCVQIASLLDWSDAKLRLLADRRIAALRAARPVPYPASNVRCVMRESFAR